MRLCCFAFLNNGNRLGAALLFFLGNKGRDPLVWEPSARGGNDREGAYSEHQRDSQSTVERERTTAQKGAGFLPVPAQLIYGLTDHRDGNLSLLPRIGH